MGTAVLMALAASHGYMVVRVLVRHVLERVLWKGSQEEQEAEKLESVVKEKYLKSLGLGDVMDIPKDGVVTDVGGSGSEKEVEGKAFWEYDEAADELQKGVKDA